MQSPLTPLFNFVFSNFSSLHPPKVSCATLLEVWPYTITIKYFPLSLFLISSILSSSTKLFIPFLFPSPAFIPSFKRFTLTRLLFIKSFSSSESFSFLTAMKQVSFRFGTNLFFIISLIIIRAFIFLRFNSFTEFGLLLLEFCNFLSLPTLLHNKPHHHQSFHISPFQQLHRVRLAPSGILQLSLLANSSPFLPSFSFPPNF